MSIYSFLLLLCALISSLYPHELLQEETTADAIPEMLELTDELVPVNNFQWEFPPTIAAYAVVTSESNTSTKGSCTFYGPQFTTEVTWATGDISPTNYEAVLPDMYTSVLRLSNGLTLEVITRGGEKSTTEYKAEQHYVLSLIGVEFKPSNSLTAAEVAASAGINLEGPYDGYSYDQFSGSGVFPDKGFSIVVLLDDGDYTPYEADELVSYQAPIDGTDFKYMATCELGWGTLWDTLAILGAHQDIQVFTEAQGITWNFPPKYKGYEYSLTKSENELQATWTKPGNSYTFRVSKDYSGKALLGGYGIDCDSDEIYQMHMKESTLWKINTGTPN